MTDRSPAGMSLADVRKDIDAIDDAMLELLARRFAIVEQVRAIKQAETPSSPLRPSREAQVLNRLATKARAQGLDPQIPVCLWPLIFAEADLAQAPVRIVLPAELADHAGVRLALHRRFGRIPVHGLDNSVAALAAAAASPFDIAVVEAGSSWLEAFMAGLAGKAHVAGVLEAGESHLIVLAQAPPESSHRDETLVVTRGSLPREFPLRPQWQVASGALHLSALPGFLSEKEAPLLGIIRSNGALGLKIIGRYPALKV